MKLTEVKYTKRFNLGNYEHEEITVAAAPEMGETVEQVLMLIKEKVEGQPRNVAETPVKVTTSVNQTAPPISTPQAPGHSPALGAYVIPVGKRYKGRTLASLSTDDIPKARGDIKFTRESALNDNRQFSKLWQQFSDNLEEYLKMKRG